MSEEQQGQVVILTITDKQARIIGQEMGAEIGYALVKMVKSASFYHRKSYGIKILAELMGRAIGKAMKE